MEPGTIIKVKYAFVLTTYSETDSEGSSTGPSWRPGIEKVVTPSGSDGAMVHGEGFMILTVVDTFKPGKWPTRVFYTRSWIDPQGRAFGKNNLRVTTLGHFKTLAKGYRYRKTSKGGVREAAEFLAKSLNTTADELLARMVVASI